jgi:hypothetical protein
MQRNRTGTDPVAGRLRVKSLAGNLAREAGPLASTAVAANVKAKRRSLRCASFRCARR